MENEIFKKRGLILILIMVTVVIFIGLVWLIATYVPWNLLGFPSPSYTAAALRVEKNCTYPIAYWKEHPELYPSQMVLGSKVYRANEINEVLSGESQDPAAQLQAQLIGAFLNVLSGADQSLINPTIFQAYGWIVQHPNGSQISDDEREAGSRLSNVLEAYNLGLAGVGPCADGVIYTATETATALWTPTFLPTSTPSETSTSTPSETASPTNQPTYPIWTVIAPSQTHIPTTQAPGRPPPSATQMPTTAPTNTFIPPTEAPTATVAQPTQTLPPPDPTLPPPPK
jgi:hypothetical protein